MQHFQYHDHNKVHVNNKVGLISKKHFRDLLFAFHILSMKVNRESTLLNKKAKYQPYTIFSVCMRFINCAAI